MKTHVRQLVFAATFVLSLASCARKITDSGSGSYTTETGKGSYYADKFQGRPTASGEKFDQNKMTAAHRTLPFGTKVTVTNTANGRSVVVTVNDRGPFAAGRIIDVSRKAASQLGIIEAGVANVKISYKKG